MASRRKASMSQSSESGRSPAVLSFSEPPAAPGSTISRLVRSKRTQEFLTPAGTWTKDIQQAARFSNQLLALEAIHKFEVSEVELYYLMGDQISPEYDFTLSL